MEMGGPKNEQYHFGGGPYKKCYSILGSMLSETTLLMRCYKIDSVWLDRMQVCMKNVECFRL